MSLAACPVQSTRTTERVLMKMNRFGKLFLCLAVLLLALAGATAAAEAAITFSPENPKAGEGRFISTYMGDGNPLPSFEGEPRALELDETFTGDIDVFTDRVWAALNEDNKVSLFVRFIDISTGEYQTRIVNKNK